MLNRLEHGSFIAGAPTPAKSEAAPCRGRIQKLIDRALPRDGPPFDYRSGRRIRGRNFSMAPYQNLASRLLDTDSGFSG